jgi:hypothetical protein
VAFIVGITPPAQYDLSPPLTGAGTTGQAQTGAVTSSVLLHPLLAFVTVIVIFVPEGTPVIDHKLPLVLVAVPAVVVTVPVIAVTTSE